MIVVPRVDALEELAQCDVCQCRVTILAEVREVSSARILCSRCGHAEAGRLARCVFPHVEEVDPAQCEHRFVRYYRGCDDVVGKHCGDCGGDFSDVLSGPRFESGWFLASDERFFEDEGGVA